MLSAVTFTCILGDKCKPVKWLKLADSLSASEAQAFMNKVKREDAKLRKLGGLGNCANSADSATIRASRFVLTVSI